MIQPAGAPRKRSAGGIARGIFLILLLALIAAIVAGIVILATDAGQSTDAGDLLQDQIDTQITKLEQYIQDHSQ